MKDSRNGYNLKMRTALRKDTTQREDIVVYHWGRIVGAVVVLLLLLATLVFLLWSWLGVPDHGDVQSKLAGAGKIISTPKEPPVTQPEPSPSKPDTPSEPKPEPDELPEQQKASTPEVEPITDAKTGTAGTDQEAPSEFVIDDPADEPEPTDAPVDAGVMANESDETDTPEDDTSASAPASSDSATIKRQSAHLPRAQLTREIKDREPTAPLPAVVSMDSDDLIKVYFFSELEGLKGKTVYHDWYLDGKRVARVPIRTYLDKMRASSSKNINRSMLGNWRAEAVTQDGEVLGFGEFTVVE